MPISLEQKLLHDRIVERVATMQRAVKAALPGNAVLHAEFRCGDPAPTTPFEAVALARLVAPAAREYKALLVNRGVDMTTILSLGKAADDLARLLAVEPPSSEPVVAEPAAPSDDAPAPASDGKGGKRKAKKK